MQPYHLKWLLCPRATVKGIFSSDYIERESNSYMLTKLEVTEKRDKQNYVSQVTQKVKHELLNHFPACKQFEGYTIPTVDENCQIFAAVPSADNIPCC